MNWRFAYTIGFHPWGDAVTDPPFAKKISELFDREEKGREPPYGPALDLGTGSGIWGIELAKRGWQVTGIDIVDKALRRARDRVANVGVDMRLVRGDVTAPSAVIELHNVSSSDAGTKTKEVQRFTILLEAAAHHGVGADRRMNGESSTARPVGASRSTPSR